ncbi:hypothetical protein [Pedobacter psychrodurus]|uniref:hypothetical protein n=1 Tax=Pedobacter psychrodurus TaxID=2530456 RepID=UPI00292DC73A|nr:hypothetical protein [Pedobacter psychrodurus]
MEKDQLNHDIVPAQYMGSSMDVSEEWIGASTDEATKRFNEASAKLLTVNEWGNYAGISAFQLIDIHGIKADREAQEGDFIRIDIPGPGTQAGHGYDWVVIIDIKNINEYDHQLLALTVRPSAHPLAQNGDTAHFLKDAATSTFLIKRDGLRVTAEEHGRNEVPNTTEGSLYDKGRNFVVGMAAKLGLSYPQWKSLVKGLLKN